MKLSADTMNKVARPGPPPGDDSGGLGFCMDASDPPGGPTGAANAVTTRNRNCRKAPQLLLDVPSSAGSGVPLSALKEEPADVLGGEPERVEVEHRYLTARRRYRMVIAFQDRQPLTIDACCSR